MRYSPLTVGHRNGRRGLSQRERQLNGDEHRDRLPLLLPGDEPPLLGSLDRFLIEAERRVEGPTTGTSPTVPSGMMMHSTTTVPWISPAWRRPCTAASPRAGHRSVDAAPRPIRATARPSAPPGPEARPVPGPMPVPVPVPEPPPLPGPNERVGGGLPTRPARSGRRKGLGRDLQLLGGRLVLRPAGSAYFGGLTAGTVIFALPGSSAFLGAPASGCRRRHRRRQAPAR